MAITITSPTNYQIFQRRNGVASIAIAGTSTASGSVRARLNGGSWQTIATVSNGMYSGVLTNQPQGQGTLDVENLSNSETASVSYVGIGDVILVAGQSNARGSATNPQAYSHATLRPGWIKVNDASWSQLTSDASQWPLIATLWMAAYGVPLGVVMTAAGSTSLAVDWNPNTPGTRYTNAVSRINSSGASDALCIYWDQGEQDATPSVNTSRSTWYTLFSQLVSAMRSAISMPSIPWVVAQTGQQGDNADQIRLAQVDAWDNISGVCRGETQYDRDAIHWEDDTEIAIKAARVFAVISNAVMGTNYPMPPRIKRTQLSGATTVICEFDRDLAVTDSDLAESAITLTNTGGTARTTSTLELRGKRQVAAVFSGTIDGIAPVINYASFNTGSNVAIPKSAAGALPATINGVSTVQMPVVPMINEPIEVDLPNELRSAAGFFWDGDHPTFGVAAERIKGTAFSLNGTTTTTSGKYGNGIQLVNGTMTLTRDNAVWWDSQRQSYSFWFYYEAPVSGVSNYTRLLMIDGTSGSGDKVNFRISDAATALTRRLEFGLGAVTCASATNSVSTTGWYHAAATIDKVKQEIKLYLNGTLVSTQTYSSLPTLTMATLQVGRSANTQTVIYDNIASFPGVVLSQADVALLYNSARGRRWNPHRYSIPSLSPIDNALRVRGVGHTIQLSCYSTITGQLIALDPSTVSVTLNKDGAGAVASTNASKVTTTEGILSLTLTNAEADAVQASVLATTTIPNISIKAAAINYRDYITRSDLPELDNLDQTISSRATPADVDVIAADVNNAIGSLADQPLSYRSLIDKDGVIRIVRGDDYKNQRRIPFRDKGKWSDLTDATLRFTAKYTDGYEITGTPALEMDDSTQVVWVQLVNSQTEVANRTEDWWSYDLEATLAESNDIETLELGRMKIDADITRPAA